MKEVVYHPRVPSEVREAIAYYDEISPKLADEFWDELTQAIDYARSFPEHHHFDPTGMRRSNLKRFPYHFLSEYFPVLSESPLSVTIAVILDTDLAADEQRIGSPGIISARLPHHPVRGFPTRRDFD